MLVPVGGGGLIGGIASHLKQANPAIQVVGCQPKNDNAMQQCVAAGKIFDIEVPSGYPNQVSSALRLNLLFLMVQLEILKKDLSPSSCAPSTLSPF